VAKYLLDANTLIEPYRRFYPPDLAPGFWQWLEEQFSKSLIVIPRMVFQEIKDGDELSKWVKDQVSKYPTIIIDPDTSITQAVGAIGAFVLANYNTEHADEFLNGGDPWLIAHGMADNQLKIITFELQQTPQRHGRTNLYQGKVRLPFVANTFGVSCVNLFDVMRVTGAKLNS
jgi:hypothetical protein